MTQPEQTNGLLERPVLRAVFESLTPILQGFAERHSLCVERYKRGFPIWDFAFRHPKGGAASIQFGLCESGDTHQLGASVLPHWWVAFEKERRRLDARFQPLRLTSVATDEVREALEHELAKVLATEETALTRESQLADRALTAVRGREYAGPELHRLSLPT